MGEATAGFQGRKRPFGVTQVERNLLPDDKQSKNSHRCSGYPQTDGSQGRARKDTYYNLVKITICAVKPTARGVKTDSKRRKYLSPVTSATTLVWGWPGQQGREWQWRVEASSPVWISLPSWPERNLQVPELFLASLAGFSSHCTQAGNLGERWSLSAVQWLFDSQFLFLLFNPPGRQSSSTPRASVRKVLLQ